MSAFRLDPLATRVHPTVFIARGAVVVGDVVLAEHANVWFSAVVRGDTDRIVVGARTNVQDGAVLHVDPGSPCVIGADVTIGHRAIVHGARVDDGALIGMGAIVMDGAHVGAEAMVAAGALVPPGKTVPPGWLVVGSPAKPVRPLTDDERARQRRGASNYVDKAHAFTLAGWHAPLGIPSSAG